MPENFHFWMLAGGLLVGVVLAWRTLKSSAPESTDLELSDLTEQREEIFAELRSLGPDASESDRETLELRAAKTLRRLEEMEARAPRAEAAAAPAEARGFVAKHPLLSGALLGGGMVGLVALLIFWAQGDAQPREDEPVAQQAPVAAPGGGGDDFDRGEPPLPPGIQSIVDEMLARLEENPDDVETRKSLLQLLLENGQFFQAFGQAREILASDPADPDGLYAMGLVRYTMGMPAEALEGLEAALASDPTYVQASLIKGIIELQIGERAAAVATWKAGVEASGPDPRLEHLLRLEAEGKTTQEILNTPPPRP